MVVGHRGFAMGQSEIPGSPIAQLQGVQALDGWCKSWFCHGGLPRLVCITLAVAEGEWHCPLEKEARENNLKKFEKTTTTTNSTFSRQILVIFEQVC